MEIENIHLGDTQIAFAKHKGKVIFPQPVQGPFVWYDFMGVKNSDSSRSIAEDLSGGVNNASLLNFAYEGVSGYNNGLVFDGVDDVAQLLVSSNFTLPATHFSYETVFEWGAVKSLNGVFRIATTGTNKNISGIELYRQGDGSIQFQMNRGSTPYSFRTTTIPVLGVKYHLVVIHRGTTIDVYTNAIVEEKQYNGPGPATPIAANSNLYIGGGNGGTRLLGNVYMFRGYDRVLTEEEIQHNFNLEKTRWDI